MFGFPNPGFKELCTSVVRLPVGYWQARRVPFRRDYDHQMPGIYKPNLGYPPLMAPLIGVRMPKATLADTARHWVYSNPNSYSAPTRCDDRNLF